LGSCNSLRVDEHHITSVFSPLSCNRFDRIQLYMSSAHSVMSDDRVDAASDWREPYTWLSSACIVDKQLNVT